MTLLYLRSTVLLEVPVTRTTARPWAVPGLSPGGPGTATAALDPAWSSWTGPHGGLLAALLLRTGQTLSPQDQEPQALTVQFLAATGGDTALLAAEVVRSGRSSSVVAATLRDRDGALTTTATLTSGRRRAGATWAGVPAPAVPDPDDLGPLELPVELVPFGQHLEYRPVGAHPLSGGATPSLLCWVRLRDGGNYDAAALALLVDVLPPALYGATTTPVPVPTVELSVLLSGAPTASGWVLTRTATRSAQDGWCVDDVEVWDGAGRLLAQSRQLRRVLGDLPLPGGSAA
ncbi:MAG: hypothetical protein JWN17_2358 [Frankiales bacterium]|nr:hypothetical protein [Frankiales bacterium]